MSESDSGEHSFEAIKYSVREGIASIVLNRPRFKNALNFVMRRELDEVVCAIQRNRAIKVLVLSGAGGAFCSGGDISTMHEISTAEQARDRMLDLHLIIENLLTLDRPIITVVEGPAYGAGLGLALTGDLILAAPNSKFCLSFLRLGAIPDCGIFYTLPRIIGVQRAKALAFSAREFGADEAAQMGIVAEIHPSDLIHERAANIAQALATLPLSVLNLTKRAFNLSLDSGLGSMLELEAAGQGIARSAPFHIQEALKFMSKEPLSFTWPSQSHI